MLPQEQAEQAQIRSELLEVRYLSLACIGRGGFHQVWAAAEVGAGGIPVPCALKIFLPDGPSGQSPAFFRDRLFTEARILAYLARLGHPNLVSIHSVFTTRSMLCLRMEFVDGLDLARIIQGRRRLGLPPVSVEIAFKLIADAARGLDAAHGATDAKGRPLNLLHLDIKPGNLILHRMGLLKVIDFGIASLRGSTGAPDHLLGTPQYMAPEQVANRPCPASDLYALGLVLYELLTLEPLIRKQEDVQAMIDEAGTLEVSPRLAGLRARHPDAAGVLEWMLQRDPDRRPPDAQHLADLLERLLGARRPDLQTFYEEELTRMLEHAPELVGPSSKALFGALPDTLQAQAFLQEIAQGEAAELLSARASDPRPPLQTLSPTDSSTSLSTEEAPSVRGKPAGEKLAPPTRPNPVPPRRKAIGWLRAWPLLLTALALPALWLALRESGARPAPLAEPVLSPRAEEEPEPAESPAGQVMTARALRQGSPVTPAATGLSSNPVGGAGQQALPVRTQPRVADAVGQKASAEPASPAAPLATPAPPSAHESPGVPPRQRTSSTGSSHKATTARTSCSTRQASSIGTEGLLQINLTTLPEDLAVFCRTTPVSTRSQTIWRLEPGTYTVQGTRPDGSKLSHTVYIEPGTTCVVNDDGVRC